MACFAVPVAEAVAVSAAYFVVKSKEKKYSLQRENGINVSFQKSFHGLLNFFSAARFCSHSSICGTARSCRGLRF